MAQSSASPVLLTLGWFRSGTTHLYELLKSALPGSTHYYEPFHPKLRELLEFYRQKKSEQPEREVLVEDPLHGKVLFQEYFANPAALEQNFQPHFGTSNFFLGEAAEFPSMRAYLESLVADEPAAHLQINRGLGRLDFLRSVFPASRLLLLVRDPRAVWASWHGQPESPFSAELESGKFKLAQMLTELKELLTEEEWQNWGFEWAQSRPPVANFLAMWSFLYNWALGASEAFNRKSVIKFETLISDRKNLLKRLAQQLNLPLEVEELPASRSRPAVKWRRNASPADYREFLSDLPETAPLKKIMAQFGYLES